MKTYLLIKLTIAGAHTVCALLIIQIIYIYIFKYQTNNCVGQWWHIGVAGAHTVCALLISALSRNDARKLCEYFGFITVRM